MHRPAVPLAVNGRDPVNTRSTWAVPPATDAAGALAPEPAPALVWPGVSLTADDPEVPPPFGLAGLQAPSTNSAQAVTATSGRFTWSPPRARRLRKRREDTGSQRARGVRSAGHSSARRRAPRDVPRLECRSCSSG